MTYRLSYSATDREDTQNPVFHGNKLKSTFVHRSANVKKKYTFIDLSSCLRTLAPEFHTTHSNCPSRNFRLSKSTGHQGLFLYFLYCYFFLHPSFFPLTTPSQIYCFNSAVSYNPSSCPARKLDFHGSSLTLE